MLQELDFCSRARDPTRSDRLYGCSGCFGCGVIYVF